MDLSHQRPVQHLLLPAICLALIAISGCNSKSESRTGEPNATAASASAGSHIDVMCIGERINNPPEPFHYSYKYSDASSSTSKEAEITSQAMDITIKDQSGSHSYHGVRSDEANWNSAVLDLSSLNMTAMTSRLDALNDTSAISRQATEAMNGYDTTRYAINSATRQAPQISRNSLIFSAGAVSRKAQFGCSADGCAVKLVLDERILLGGKLKDAHYELARSRK